MILSNKYRCNVQVIKRYEKPCLLQKKARHIDSTLENKVIRIFKESHNNYGSKKIKIELKKTEIIASRRKNRNIMKKYNLVSNYTVKQYKVDKANCNNDLVNNVVKRKFNDRNHLEVVVSDLTYVRVKNKWHYICLLINLFNREIIGFSAYINVSARSSTMASFINLYLLVTELLQL